MWFFAHNIMYFLEERESSSESEDPANPRPGKQVEFIVWENIIALNADSLDSARRMANAIGQEEQNSSVDSGLSHGGTPVRMIYAGARQIVDFYEGDGHMDIIQGTEITYNSYIIKTLEDFLAFANGKSVSLIALPVGEESD